METAPTEPSSSVATGDSDATDTSGKASSGTCHICGGGLRRGNVKLARQCPVCKTRFHFSDCGKRRSNAGYAGPYDACPKCTAQCRCVGGNTMCHTSSVRVARILKRVAAISEPTDVYNESAGARRAGESVRVRRRSASNPGLGKEPMDENSLHSTAVHHAGSSLDSLHEVDRLCMPVVEDAEMDPGRGASKAEPRRRWAEHARAVAAPSAAPRGDPPAFAFEGDANFDWPAALLRVAANEADDGIVDEAHIPDSGAAQLDDGRGGGGGSDALRRAAASGTPSQPFDARTPDFPGVAAYDLGGHGEGIDHGHQGHHGFSGNPVRRGDGDGDDEFTEEHATVMWDILGNHFPDEKGN